MKYTLPENVIHKLASNPKMYVCMKKRPKNMRDNFNDSLGKAIIIILKHLHYWIKGQMEMGMFTLNRTMKEYIKVSVHIIGTTTTNAKKSASE